MKRIFAYALVALFAPFAGVVSAQAEAGDAGLNAEMAHIDVLPGWRMANGRHVAAVRIRLADGWKTYWRAPGDLGIPPSLNWQGSGNVASIQFHWPVPDVYRADGVRTIGYQHELVLPMTVTPRDPSSPISLEGELSLGVCRDVCVPMSATLKTSLPAGGAVDRSIKRALRQRPDTAKEAGVRKASCAVEPISDGLRLTANIQVPALGAHEDVVIETPDPEVWVSQAMTSRQGKTLTAVADLVPPNGGVFTLNRADIRLTVLGSGRGIDIRGCTGG